jgi:hypothetical protein
LYQIKRKKIMKNKKEFMLLFSFNTNNSHTPSNEELTEIHEQWGAYIGYLALQEKLVSTYQLSEQGATVSAKARVKKSITVANNYSVGGNMVINANSLKEALTIAKACPILKMNGMVEVRNIQTM